MLIHIKRDLYEKYIKRLLDIVFSVLFIVTFGWLYIIIAITVKIEMGSPVIFKQLRPGIVKNDKETIFYMYKFRSMTDEKDINGNLLPDDQRLPKFGALLRSTSLDELPEIFNILKGDMSFVGPRPQLVKDMVFMTKDQRVRHVVKPGLTGLAQVKGRNSISWKEKLDLDLEYVENISFLFDAKIVFETIVTVFKRVGITDGENATSKDYGDVLLEMGVISQKDYDVLQKEAEALIENYKNREN